MNAHSRTLSILAKELALLEVPLIYLVIDPTLGLNEQDYDELRVLFQCNYPELVLLRFNLQGLTELRLRNLSQSAQAI